MKNIIFFAFAIVLSINISAQDVNAFYEKLNATDNFYDAMRVVNAEYENLPQEIRDKGGEGYKKEKHWRRWEHWMSSHVDADGSYVNISQMTQDALEQIRPYYNTNKTTNSNWISLGPSTSAYESTAGYCVYNGIGRVDRIAFHPSNANIIYAGMPAGGLWRTTNGGTSWSNLQSFTPSMGVSGIVVSHANANTIYVLTGDGDSDISGGFVRDFGYIRPSAGVFKSTDNGVTWQQTGQLSANSYVGFKLAMDPTNANELYAATSDGLWRTTNGGTSWSQIRTGRIFDVKCKPGSSTTVYCATNTNVQRSTNSGSTWSTSTYDINPPSGRKTLAVTNANANYLYVMCGPGGSSGAGTFGGFYRSTNSGSSFTRRTNTPNIMGLNNSGSDSNDASIYVSCAAVKHNNVNRIVMGSLICFRSTNGGTTFTNSTTYGEVGGGGPGYVHPDIHAMEYNPVDNKVYVGGDGGISVSSDDGATWTDITNGMRITQSYHLDQFEGSTSLLLGNQDNGVKRRSSGSNFPHVAGGDGFYVSYDPNDVTRFLSTINRSTYLFTNNGDNRSSNISPTTQWYKTVEFHNTNASIALCGTNTIYKSTNMGVGSTWTNEGASGSWALASCPSNNARFYATGRTNYQPSSLGKAYVSSNTGDTWTDLSGNTGFPGTVTKLTDISVRQINSPQVWMTCGGYNAGSKVYYSSNTGTSWTNMSGSLPNVPVHCIALSDGNDAFIGTDVGVFYRSNAMSDWIPFSNNLENVPVIDIRLDHDQGNIYIATFGRGVYFNSIPDNICVATQTISGTREGYYYYEASDTLASSASMPGTAGNQMYLKAANRVVLKPGFHAESTAMFEAFVAPCGTGGVPTANGDNGPSSSKSLETEGDGSFKKCRFNIEGDNVEFYIKESKRFAVKLLDENFQEIGTLFEGKMSEGTNAQNFNLSEYRGANQMYYIGLFDDERRHYLQEIY